MSNAVFAGDTSGSITVQVPAVAGTNILTLPAKTGNVAVDGPAFSAYNTSSQSITANTFTKVVLQNELFDTANCFDNTTNYRFTPNVAGYYQINGLVRATGTSLTGAIAVIYKNGSVYTYGEAFDGTTTSSAQLNVSEIIYLNGTTDYVELWGYITATSPSFGYSATYINCRFNGALVRGA